MNHDALHQRLQEVAWRRPLTREEQTQLRQLLQAKPELQREWETEAGLNELLHRLPDAPIPSNFTARVMQEVQLETARASRASSPASGQESRSGFWRRWLPRLGLAGSVAAVMLVLATQVRSEREQREEMAQSLALVAEVSSLPGPEILQDFEVIRTLSRTPAADEQLLNLFQ